MTLNIDGNKPNLKKAVESHRLIIIHKSDGCLFFSGRGTDNWPAGGGGGGFHRWLNLCEGVKPTLRVTGYTGYRASYRMVGLYANYFAMGGVVCQHGTTSEHLEHDTKQSATRGF